MDWLVGIISEGSGSSAESVGWAGGGGGGELGQGPVVWEPESPWNTWPLGVGSGLVGLHS